MIEHNPTKGTTIDAAIANAIILTIQYDSKVNLIFNDVILGVYKTSNPEEIKKEYIAKLIKYACIQRV